MRTQFFPDTTPAPNATSHSADAAAARDTVPAAPSAPDMPAPSLHHPAPRSALLTALVLPMALAEPSAAAAAAPPAMMQQVSEATADRVARAKNLRNAKHFSEALAVLAVENDGPGGPHAKLHALDRSELYLWRGKVSQFAKDIPSAVAALDEAQTQAEQITDPLARCRQLAYIIFQHGMALRAGGDLGAAFAKFQQAEPHLRAVIDSAAVPLTELCDMLHNLAFMLDQRGLVSEAIAAYEELLPQREKAGKPQPLGYTLARLGVLLCKTDRRAEGIALLRRGVALIEEHGSKSVAEDYNAQLAALERCAR